MQKKYCLNLVYKIRLLLKEIKPYTTRTIEDALRSERDEWKADAEKLASLVEDERNAYDLMGRGGVTGITDEGYLKLERTLMDHNSLVEKEEKK